MHSLERNDDSPKNLGAQIKAMDAHYSKQGAYGDQSFDLFSEHDSPIAEKQDALSAHSTG